MSVNYNKLKDYYNEQGCEPWPANRFIESPYLNIYAYPEELDYIDFRPLPEKWHRFDSFIRSPEPGVFDIPDKLKEKPGKLIFLSMGSVGSFDVDLMKRLVNLVSDLPYRFIVAKGNFNIL